MPTTKHIEKHFTAGEVVRDIVIGMADGLTVPFALAAGLSGALASSRLVVVGGLAEVAAGAIAMGLGGYLAAKSDRDHYLHERQREMLEVIEKPEQEKREVEEIFRTYGMNEEDITPILHKFQLDPKAWVDFMMRFELGIEEPNPKRARTSAFTIAISYIIGGLIPLVPYMVTEDVYLALRFSCLLTLIALALFGYVKGKFAGNRPLISAIQTLCIGSLAAGVAFVVARAVLYYK